MAKPKRDRSNVYAWKMHRMEEPPPDSTLYHVQWTIEKAKQMPWITWKRPDEAYVGERRLVFPEQKQAILEAEFKQVPPRIGFLRWHYILMRKYAGLRRIWVEEFLRQQAARQIYQPLRKGGKIELKAAERPLWAWQMDFGNFGPEGIYTLDGRRYVAFLVIVDVFTKLTFVYPVKAESTAEVIRCLTLWREEIEKLKPGGKRTIGRIQSDNGSAFNDELTNWLGQRQIKLIKGRPYTPQGQGAAERMVQTVKNGLRSLAEQRYPTSKKLPWPRVVDDVMHVINNGYTRILAMSPLEAAKADPQTIKAKLDAQRQTRQYYKNYHDDPLAPGDKVRVSLRIDGTTEVKKQIKDGTYKSSNRQWGDAIYTVEKRHGQRAYYLKEREGRYLRTDLLRIPADTNTEYDATPEPPTPPAEPTPKRRRTPSLRLRMADETLAEEAREAKRAKG